MKKIIVLFILSLAPIGSLISHEETPKRKEIVRTDEEELKYLNKQIDNLRDLRDYYNDKAARSQSRGRRLTFQSSELRTEARQQLLQAEEYKKIAVQIDKEITVLESQREALLKRMGHPSATDPCQ